jgi:hypothetical protein
MIQILP